MLKIDQIHHGECVFVWTNKSQQFPCHRIGVNWPKMWPMMHREKISKIRENREWQPRKHQDDSLSSDCVLIHRSIDSPREIQTLNRLVDLRPVRIWIDMGPLVGLWLDHECRCRSMFDWVSMMNYCHHQRHQYSNPISVHYRCYRHEEHLESVRVQYLVRIHTIIERPHSHCMGYLVMVALLVPYWQTLPVMALAFEQALMDRCWRHPMKNYYSTMAMWVVALHSPLRPYYASRSRLRDNFLGIS